MFVTATAVLVTNALTMYFGYRGGCRVTIMGVRRVLQHMGGDDMERQFLKHADQVIAESQAGLS